MYVCRLYHTIELGTDALANSVRNTYEYVAVDVRDDGEIESSGHARLQGHRSAAQPSTPDPTNEEQTNATGAPVTSHSIAALSPVKNWETDIFTSSCSDPLCTQYLSETDLATFMKCTQRSQRKSNSACNGTCRFVNGTTRQKVALISFPGSGNTWVRGLLEKATGICTGGYTANVLGSLTVCTVYLEWRSNLIESCVARTCDSIEV